MVIKKKANKVNIFEPLRKTWKIKVLPVMNHKKSKLEKLFYDIKSKSSEKRINKLFVRSPRRESIRQDKEHSFLVFFAENNIFVKGEKGPYVPKGVKIRKVSTFITENEYIKLICAFKIDSTKSRLMSHTRARINHKLGVHYNIPRVWHPDKEFKIKTLLDDKFLPRFKKATDDFYKKGESSVEAITEFYRKEIKNMGLAESIEQELIIASQELKNIGETGLLINYSIELGKTIITAAIVGLGVKDIVDARMKGLNTVRKTKKEKFNKKAFDIGKFIFDKLLKKADANRNIYLNSAIKSSYEDTRREHDRYKSRFNTPGKVNKIPKSEILKKYLTTYLQETHKDWFSECPDELYLEYILKKLGYNLIQ